MRIYALLNHVNSDIAVLAPSSVNQLLNGHFTVLLLFLHLFSLFQQPQLLISAHHHSIVRLRMLDFHSSVSYSAARAAAALSH